MFCLLSLGLTACGKEKWEEIDTLGQIVEDVCYNNAKEFFGF